MSHEGDATVIAKLSPTFLLVKHLNRCIFSLLRYATPPPHSDDDAVEVSEGVELSFVGQNLQELGRDTIGPYCLSVLERPYRLLYFVPRLNIRNDSVRQTDKPL